MQVRHAPGWMPVVAMVGMALTVGGVAAASPLRAIVLACLVLGGSLAVVAGPRLPRTFLSCLGALLIGYAFLGKGFGYLGVPPLYVGELVLCVGVAAVLVGNGIGATLRTSLGWLWVALAAVCAMQTIPYLGSYGMAALRDAVIWGYGAFALLVAAYLTRRGDPQLVPMWYARWFPWFLIWTPVAWYLARFWQDSLPRVPGTSVAILGFNPSDVGVHLGGGAAFLLLGLRQRPSTRGAPSPGTEPRGLRLPAPVEWAFWFVSFALVASWTRGGAVAALVAVLLVLVIRPATVTRVIWGGVIGTVAALTFLAFDISIDTGGYRGKISPQELTANLVSVFRTDRTDSANREGNREWRLEWWTRIVDYTVFGDRFWTGKGFGINLADDDGFQVNQDGSLRSPHNGHMTFLARAGVPGAALWIILQAAFAVSLVRAYLRARRVGDEWWQRLDLWILAYWSAFQLNAAFDVYLEGPQGGIWFWSLFGFGMWAVASQRNLGRAAPSGAVASVPQRFPMGVP